MTERNNKKRSGSVPKIKFDDTDMKMHSSIPVVMIPVNEYNELKNDIIEKNDMIMQLNHDADMLRTEMQKNYAIIKELENTNNECKSKINELTIMNESLTQKIKDLEEEVKNHKMMNDVSQQKIQQLEEKIQQLEKKSRDEDHKKMLRKYCMAIQDYNNRYEIEKRMKSSRFRYTMKMLRMDRNGECHYCDQSFDDNEANEMFYIMYNRINTMPQEIMNDFETEYPGLLNEIKQCLNDEEFLMPSKEIFDLANRWWDKL